MNSFIASGGQSDVCGGTAGAAAQQEEACCWRGVGADKADRLSAAADGHVCDALIGGRAFVLWSPPRWSPRRSSCSSFLPCLGENTAAPAAMARLLVVSLLVLSLTLGASGISIISPTGCASSFDASTNYFPLSSQLFGSSTLGLSQVRRCCASSIWWAQRMRAGCR